jgi:hypothetical protein
MPPLIDKQATESLVHHAYAVITQAPVSTRLLADLEAELKASIDEQHRDRNTAARSLLVEVLEAYRHRRVLDQPLPGR